MNDKKLKAVGITCGIGSMLVGARAAGFTVAGQLEWRKYYHAKDETGRNTFTENFPGALFREKIEGLDPADVERLMDADIALGHPECGNFSVLSGPNLKAGHDHRGDPADIPLFVDLVARLRPRFFVMDDLPGSLVSAFPMSEYARRLPDYDLFPEWISNWNYGNVQKGRNRFFMLGARRTERWAFVPGEVDAPKTVREEIGDLNRAEGLGSNFPNNEVHADHFNSTLFISDGAGGRRHANWSEVADIVRAMPEGKTIPYLAADCVTVKLKVGFFRPRWDGHSYVLTGGPNSSLHPTRCNPYSVRERARLQGFPDDFIFYGTKLEADGTWHILRNIHMVKQTGKAMPIQFCTYVARQVAAHIRGEPFATSGRRLLRPREEISAAKRWYCESVGYADQARACSACWLYPGCTIRMRKYGIGEPAVGQRDLIDPGVVPGPEPEDCPDVPCPDCGSPGECLSGCPSRLGEDGAAAVEPEGAAAPRASSPGPRRARPRRGDDPGQRRASAARPAQAKRFADLPRDEEYDLFDGDD